MMPLELVEEKVSASSLAQEREAIFPLALTLDSTDMYLVQICCCHHPPYPKQ